MNAVILEDTFTVTEVNLEKTVYARVTRITCVSDDGDLVVHSDFNTEQFPVSMNERLTIMLTSSLEPGGEVGSTTYDHSVYLRPTRLNECDYAMHGRVYGHEVKEDSLDVEVHISCGGLLTRIRGKPQSLRNIHYNSELYILVKRAGR